jgi:hypothetical protein
MTAQDLTEYEYFDRRGHVVGLKYECQPAEGQHVGRQSRRPCLITTTSLDVVAREQRRRDDQNERECQKENVQRRRLVPG